MSMTLQDFHDLLDTLARGYALTRREREKLAALPPGRYAVGSFRSPAPGVCGCPVTAAKLAHSPGVLEVAHGFDTAVRERNAASWLPGTPNLYGVKYLEVTA